MKVAFGFALILCIFYFAMHSRRSHDIAETDDEATQTTTVSKPEVPASADVKKPYTQLSTKVTPPRTSPSITENIKTMTTSEVGPERTEPGKVPTGVKVNVSSSIATRVQSGHQTAGLQQQMVESMAKKMNVSPTQIQVYSPESNYPGENVIASNTLSFVNCQVLDNIPIPLTLRVNGSGYITEVASLIPGRGVPPLSGSLSSCQVQGGPSEPFVTTRMPAGNNE